MIVVLESPYKGTEEQIDYVAEEISSVFGEHDDLFKDAQQSVYEDNVEYANHCLLDSLKRGESPMASHLLYTQCLDDTIAEERKLGIEAGHKFIDVCDFMAVYIDHGISEGMKQGIAKAEKLGKRIEYRRIYDV